MSKTRGFVLAASMVLAMAFTFSCSSDDGGGSDPSSSSVGNGGGVSSSATGRSSSSAASRSSSSAAVSASSVRCSNAGNGTFTDTRDNKTYGYVTICSQTWLAENLNYDVESSYCYDNDPAICEQYGRLYNWDTALTACPDGWHLPSNAEWTVLTNYAGGVKTAGIKLKAKSGWYRDSSGTDDYGFSALPGGVGYSDGGFGGLLSIGLTGVWWVGAKGSDDVVDYASARARAMDSGRSEVSEGFTSKSRLHSVRCIQDDTISAIISGSSVTYGGQTYETVVIGTQTWMAENLNYEVEGSKCYDNDPANCAKYGRLYNWITALVLPSSCNSNFCTDQIQSPHQGICPDNWHIPSEADWDILRNYVGSSLVAGTKLKATGWNSYGNDIDQYGFSALPGGYGDSDGSFNNVGDNGSWWGARGYNFSSAYGFGMNYNSESAGWGTASKSSLRSVRCVLN